MLFAYIFSLPDGKLHLVFCDVGQGDAAYIRTPDNFDMLIDGGPSSKVLDCLGKNMPFYDHSLDVVVLSHPQKDHLQGLIDVVERYSVKYFVIGVIGNETEGYKKLVEIIKQEKIPYKNLYQGDNFSLGQVRFNVLWPERQWVASKIKTGEVNFQLAAVPGQAPIESGQAVLGLATTADLNDFSYLLHLNYGQFDALFTGDGDSGIQPEVMAVNNLPDVEVLKFPHHGSKTGILPEFLAKIKPEAAVISVGKNPWGHPTKEALQILSDNNIQTWRTDLLGEIEIETDGTTWTLH